MIIIIKKKTKWPSRSVASLYTRLLAGLLPQTQNSINGELREKNEGAFKWNTQVGERYPASRSRAWVMELPKLMRTPTTSAAGVQKDLLLTGPEHFNAHYTITSPTPPRWTTDSPFSPDRSRGWWECLSGCEWIAGHTFHDQNRWSLKTGAAEHEPPPTPPEAWHLLSALKKDTSLNTQGEQADRSWGYSQKQQ